MKIALFFTRGVSIKEWIDKGLFDRETALYDSLATSTEIENIYLLTYGANDVDLFNEIKNDRKLSGKIKVISKPAIFKGKLGDVFYTFLMPFLQRRYIKEVSTIKTNQIDGSLSAVISSLFINKKAKLVGRCGYLLSSLEEKMNSQNMVRNFIISKMEEILFVNSDVCVFASNNDRDIAVSRYGIPNSKTKVLYNYIDEDIFTNTDSKRFNKFVFVGRIEAVKNLENTIIALSKTDYQLDIYGDGSLLPEIKRLCIENNYNVEFKGVVRNYELPKILNQYKYYIQCSYQEGMPKTLIEAIACGCIAIGSDVKGINEVILNGETGYLTNGTDPEAITKVILGIDERENLKISENLSAYVLNKYSLTNYVYREINEIYEVGKV